MYIVFLKTHLTFISNLLTNGVKMKKRNQISTLMLTLLTSAGVYAAPALKNPLVYDGETADARTAVERTTYKNQVVPSVVEGPGHTVIGQSNVVKATDGSTTVIGGQNFVADTAKDGNIFGDGSSITGYQSQAGGDNNHLVGEQNSAFGMNNQINGNHTHAFGGGNNVTGDQSTATGHYNLITGHNASAFGYDNKAQANETTVVGHQSIASGLNAGAFGSKATASGESALALGTGANATADSTVAIGNDSNATGKSSVAVGESTNATGVFATALGDSSTATGNRTIAVSVDAKAKADESIAVGSASTSEGIRSIAIGANATATNESATVVGTHSTADIRGTVIGAESMAHNHGFAGGYQAKATGESSTAIGVRANSTGLSTIAIGSDSVANNKASTAIGQGATADASYGVALGKAATATHGSAVALGTATTTEQAVSVTEATVGKLTYGGFAGTDATAVVSVGKKGDHTRQIINVGAGEISATSTDAINGSQLYATQDVLNNVAGSVTNVLGGNAALDNKGNITMTDIGGTGENTVHDAIKSHNDKIATNTVNIYENGNKIAENAENIANNAEAIENNLHKIETNAENIAKVEAKIPTVTAGDNTTVDVTVDENGKATYKVSSKDFQPAIDANAKAIKTNTADIRSAEALIERNATDIAENTKGVRANAEGIAENKAGIKSNAEGVKANTAKIVEVEKEARRHSVVKSGKHTTVTQTTGSNGEAIYTVDANVDDLATKAEVSDVRGATKVNAANIATNARAIKANAEGVRANAEGIRANAKAIGNLDRKIHKVEKKARAGVASAIAVANIPQVTLPGHSAVGVGVGGHAGQHAVAARYTRMSDNAKWIISGSVGVTTQREVNYGAGVTYQW